MQERHNLSFKKLVITMKCGANAQDQIDISAQLLYCLLYSHDLEDRPEGQYADQQLRFIILDVSECDSI